MANDTDSYRLWQHDVQPPKKSERTVIAKVRAQAPGPTRAPAGTLSGSARAVRSAGVPTDSALVRLLENGHASHIKNVFDEGPAGRGGRSLSMLGGSAAGPGRGPRAARPAQLVEIGVSRGTSPAQLAAQVERMKGVEYAFVPPVRRLFGRRKTKADPMASRQWAHGAIRLGHARAAARFDNATRLTVAVVDSGIDPKHPDLKAVIAEDKTSSAARRRTSSATAPTSRASSPPVPKRAGHLGRVRREDPGPQSAAA